MKIEVAYGNGIQAAEIDSGRITAVVRPNDVVQKSAGRASCQMALAEPVGTPRLRDMVEPGQKIVIVTSDITRPMPSAEVLPMVMDELYEAGVSKSDVTIVLARGNHRAHTEEEKKKLIGSLYGEISCMDSDPDDCVRVGTTGRGIPVDISRVVAEADKKICLGNIEYHYFAGYSGGAKPVMPGTSTMESMERLYSAMIAPGADIGRREGNPIREEIDEAASICGIDFILNVVLDETNKIVFAVAGDPVKAHARGCEFLDRMYRVDIPGRADIVIASQGGYPRDINLYQTEKALENAKYAVKDGGTIILVGACSEGLGSETFREWMLEAGSPEDLVERIHREFKLGGHKAATMAMVLQKADVYLVSELDRELAARLFVKPYSELQQAVDDALKKQGSDAEIIVMPFGRSTLPME